MSDFWNARYATTEFVYGKDPNRFLREQLGKLNPGKILFPAEGEGRNAVYAAMLGFEVFAFDSSENARVKALNLAEQTGVGINYKLNSFQDVVYPSESFDVIALIFAHMPATLRKSCHRKLVGYLKPGGKLILQGFSKEQLRNNTGGPKDINMLYSEDVLAEEFDILSDFKIEKRIINLREGQFHNGMASVINLTGVK